MNSTFLSTGRALFKFGSFPIALNLNKKYNEYTMVDTAKKIRKIVVDRNLCIGAASCVIAAATVFELDAENKAVILLKGDKKNSGPADRSELADAVLDDATILAAAQSCPTKAILLYDEQGNVLNA